MNNRIKHENFSKKEKLLQNLLHLEENDDSGIWLQPLSFFVAELELDTPINKKIPVISLKKTKSYTNVITDEQDVKIDFNEWTDFSFHAMKNTFEKVPFLVLQLSSKQDAQKLCFILFSNLDPSMAALFQSDTDSTLLVYPSKINELCSFKCPFEWVEGDSSFLTDIIQ